MCRSPLCVLSRGWQEADGSSEEQCPLSPQFIVKSDMNEVRSGHFRAFVHVETWCVAAAAS